MDIDGTLQTGEGRMTQRAVNGLAIGPLQHGKQAARVGRAKTVWLCLLPLLLFAAGAARASAAGDRDVAVVSFDPMSDQLSGTHRCTLDVIYDGTHVSAGLRGYHLEIVFDDTYVYVDSLDIHVTEGSFLSDVGGTVFLVERVDESTFVVDCAMLGATGGATGVGDLCSIAFTGRTGDGISVVDFSEVRLRDADNRWIQVSDEFAVLELDNTLPDSEAGPVAPYYNIESFNVPFTASDAGTGVRHVELYYQLDGGGYVQYGSTFTVSPIAFTAPGEGAYEFYTIGTDNVGNVEDAPPAADCTTVVDSTPPLSPVDLVALPGNNAISLSWWTVPAGRDAPVEGTLLVRQTWGAGAYPEYDDWGAPYGYPTHQADGFVVEFVPGTGPQTFEDTGFTDASRNVYYYTAFTRDSAGNYSVAASTAQARSTSYWLADVREPTDTPGTYDGFVDYYDKIAYSYSYYSAEGEPHYDNELDVGPTDDGSRMGIPLTDNIIDFEDVMILAMNYGDVSPASIRDEGPPDTAIRDHAVLALEWEGLESAVGDVMEVNLTLRVGEGYAKGVSSVITFDEDALEFLSAVPGEPVGTVGESFFFAREEAGRLRVDFAVLGLEATMPGSCAVATLRFLVSKEEPSELDIDDVVLRDPWNSDITCLASGLHLDGSGKVPLRLRLGQNVRNPFNPRTTIAFDLPKRCSVTLRIYGVDGREVAALVDEPRDAGAYEVSWDGTGDRGADAASGVYFYVLETGGLRLTQKMVLMR
jgi:hypothetical protein